MQRRVWRSREPLNIHNVILTSNRESTPAPSLAGSRGSFDATAGPPSPAETVMSTHPAIKTEPSDLPTLISPPAFEDPDPKSASLPHLDATQHSAEMLCDLPCPSTACGSRTSTTIKSRPSSTSATSWLMPRLFLQLLTLNLTTTYRQILLALWTHSPSRMARMMQASTIRLAAATRSRSTISSTMTPYPSRSTRPLAQLNAATGLASREGAHVALVRSSSAMKSRLGSGKADATRRRSSVSAAALEDQGQGGTQGKDGVGG